MTPPPKRGHTAKLIVVWLSLMALFACAMAWQGRSPLSVLQTSVDWLKSDPLGPAVLMLLFLTRSITLIPAMALSVISGYCYGTARGLAFAMTATLICGLVAFGLGRRLGGDPAAEASDSRFSKYRARLRSHGFTTTVLMRWMSLPYDPCSYLAGSLGVGTLPFLLATAIGNLPGTFVTVAFGAGIKGRFSGQMPHLDWRLPVGGIALVLLASLVYSRVRKTATPVQG